MRITKCEFCQKLRFSKCEFLDKLRIFAPVCPSILTENSKLPYFFTDDNPGLFTLSLLHFWSYRSFLAFSGCRPRPFTGMPNLWSHLLPRYRLLPNVSRDFCWRFATLGNYFYFGCNFYFSPTESSAKVSLRFFTALRYSWKKKILVTSDVRMFLSGADAFTFLTVKT